LIKEKKKAEEEKKLFAEQSPASKEAETDKKKEKPAQSKEIRFGSKPTSFYSQTNEFPTLKEAAKIGSSPKKEERKAPHVEKQPTPEKPAEMSAEPPRFTNTKKKDDKPVFAKLEEQKEHAHAGELISSPYVEKDRPSREFMVSCVRRA